MTDNFTDIPIISPTKFFSDFFSYDQNFTEKIFNQLFLNKEALKTVVDKVQPCSLEFDGIEEYPFVVLESHIDSIIENITGHTTIALVPIEKRITEAGDLVNDIVDIIRRRWPLTYPLVCLFDTAEDWDEVSADCATELSILDDKRGTFGLCINWLKRPQKHKNTEFFSDLLAKRSEEIKDDDMRRVYLEVYQSCGYQAQKEAEYKARREDMRKDIAELGLKPEDFDF